MSKKNKKAPKDEDLSKLSRQDLIERLYDSKLDGMENREARKPLRNELKKRES